MFSDDDLSPSRSPEPDQPDDPFERAACLAPLPPAVIATLRSRNQPLTFPKGAVIFRQSTPGDRVLLVLRGRVKLSRKIGRNRSRTLRILNPGDCHCCSPVGDGSPSPVSAECLTDAEVVVLRSDLVGPVASAHQAGAEGMIRCLSRRLVESMEKGAEWPLRSVPRRVASVLMDLLRSQAGTPGTAAVLKGITHEEVAACAGTVREVASRALSTFEKEGILRTGRGRITILEPDRLERIAEGSAG